MEEESTTEEDPGNDDDETAKDEDAKDADDGDDDDDEPPTDGDELPWEDPTLELVTPVLDASWDDPLPALLEVPMVLVPWDADEEDAPADDAALLPREEARRLLDPQPDAEVAPLVVTTPDEVPTDWDVAPEA